MHLLAAQKGSLSDEGEALDLAQSPGDVLFLSAADTELAALAGACASGMQSRWRLANLMQLKHPLSVDTYAAKSVAKAKLVVVRALGGASYFAYALEAFHAAAVASGARIAVLPGDERPDPELANFSTLEEDVRAQLLSYLAEGGTRNFASFVEACEAIVTGDRLQPPAVLLIRAGLFWPGVSAPAVGWLSDTHF